MLKLVRLFLGGLIALGNVITRGPRKKRSPEVQSSIEEQLKKLSLYQFKLCPFCIKVRRKMHQLNLPIELRDAKSNAQHRSDLEQQGGKIKVPCLRIETPNGTQWLYESSDINRFLEREFS